MRAISRFLRTLLVLLVIAIGGIVAYAYSGYYDLSVGTGHNAVTHWFFETLRDNSIERRAAAIEVPPLEGAEMVRAGAVGYDQSCAGCHGRPGREPSDSFDPRPPALTRGQGDPAATFWAIRNGIKMSAMPARGEDQMSNEDAWQIVAFLQTASSLTEGEYRELVEPPPEPEPAEDNAAEAEAGDGEVQGEDEGGDGESGTGDEEQPESEDDPPGEPEGEDADG
ncbi:MAG: cytochrome c [Wenzhouxiangellaceae bacterium]